MFILLILTFPTDNASLRMRIWRALKSAGAATLRDGVYVLPERPNCRAILTDIAAEVEAVLGGAAYTLQVDGAPYEFQRLFDRAEDYAAIVADVAAAASALTPDTASATLKAVRKLRKTFESVSDIDFFPGQAKQQTEAALEDLERKIAQALSPDEPHFIEQSLQRLNVTDYQGRTWATRQRPWVDRMASAWLIRRFIDKDAKILWLASPSDAPRSVLGFDYDGATFTHVGHRVTFEVIAVSFGLETDAIKRIGGIVHFLDVGGLQPPEAAGLESVLKGIRAAFDDDDALMVAASVVFDGLHASFGGA